MENTPENYQILLNAFDTLSWMPKYPEEPKQIKDRVTRLFKIVRNKACLEVIMEGMLEANNKYAHANFLWDHDFDGERQKFTGAHTKRFGSPDRNDLDWLIDTIGETCDELPTQKGIRELYCNSGLRPADGKRMRDLESE